ncbi:MAG: molecular chaperone DnaK [Candidatus Sumerlaeota bacterium]|nr:molecular chaperone DnaK [Candidatus Sumerlaeota bacterium]
MANEDRIIGIDLGTTNSVVAICMGSEPEVIPTPEGSNKTPSIVAFLENGEVVVGEIARRQAATNPKRTISSVKRLMGQSLEDVEEHGTLFPFQLVEHDDELLIDIDGMGYRPEQISALVLKKLKESAEEYLGDELTKAVITVPAYFDDIQRQATIDAAQMAGLEVLRLINEPTAAAMAYGMGQGQDTEEIIAVYDFGGGTFDISILEITGRTFEVLTSTGDSRLGGDDLDNAIVNLIVDEFQEEHGIDLMQDPVTLRRLKEVAERAKCELSMTQKTAIALPFITYKDGQPLHLDRMLSRRDFEALIEDFVRRTIRCCKRALEEANLRKSDINRVIMVGGTTRIPMVEESVEEFFDQAVFKGVNPDEVVALGAATQAGVFGGHVQEVVLLDVTPHSLGIEVEGGKFVEIIEKNSTIPIKAAKTFTTTEDDQEFVRIHVLQGESKETAENRSLGKFSLSGMPPGAPAGVPRVRVTFFINADGVVEISAEEMNSGKSEAMTIVHSNLTDDEKQKRSRRRSRARKGSSGTRRASTARRKSNRAVGADDSGVRGEKPFTKGTALRGKKAQPEAALPPSVPPAPPAREPDETAPDHQQFAVLGDTQPSPTERGHRSREAVGHSLAPVDYSKTPPTYSHMSSGQVRQIPDPPPAENEPIVPDSPGGPERVPETIRETDYLRDGSLPEDLVEARDLAEQGRDDKAAQEIYAKAVNRLKEAPFDTDKSFATAKARVLICTMAGMLEEARAGLATLREGHLAENGETILALHDKVLERFGAPSVLRDRGLARRALGMLAEACADIEQATRQEPLASDRDLLSEMYRQRSEEHEDPQAMFKLVKLLLKKNEVDEAIEVLQILKGHEAYEQRALKVLGLCHWQKNLHFLAWQSFKVLPVDDDMKDILYRLAGDMESSDQLKNAVSVLEHLVASAPTYLDTEARLRKLNYRLKLQREEELSHRDVPVLSRESRFTILEEINRGSMGIIYKAKDKTLNEILALKVLNDYLCSDPAAVERFKAEARAAKRLSHPYIVRIHDLFEFDSKRFISMEYIEGVDLKRMISERTRFTEEQIIYYFIQICDALSYAHQLGIVHRDIKPANIMITDKNNVKITDFGIAKILLGEDATKSGTAVIGTPLYMAPEQIIGERVDGRTDIYALGIMMYEMVSGNPPFYLGNIEYHHIHTAPPELPERVSPKLAKIIVKMIAKKPEDRYQSVDEILAEVRS